VADAIESVGLSDLLGMWRSPGWQVVKFENYNSMSLYRPKFLKSKTGSNLMSFAKFKDLSYTLAPETGSSFSIFLAEKQANPVARASVYVGRIHLAKDLVTLEIYDPRNGKILETLSLSPVRD
jgi:hypothetical protein